MAHFKLILKARPIWLLVSAVVVALVVGLLIPTSASFRGPLVDINDAILIAVLVALGAFVAQLYVDRGQTQARIAKLEDRIAGLETAKGDALDKLSAAASFINRVGWWLTTDQHGPMPQPPDQILPHIDAELWEPDAPGGTDPN